jgi:hypothetical protein
VTPPRVTRLLTVLCGLLMAVVAAEATNGPVADGQARQRPAAAERAMAQAVKAAPRAGGMVGQWVAVALARPLFAPDRKPVAGTLAADPGMPRLTGIVASVDRAVAIFQPTGDAKPLVALRGEMVDGWQVTAITADAVNLRKQNQVIILSPRFNGIQHDGTAAPDVKKLVSRWEVAAPTGLLRARWSNPQLQP